MNAYQATNSHKTAPTNRAAPALMLKGLCLVCAWMVSSCSWDAGSVERQASLGSQQVAMATARPSR
jgi:hypothetical protein